MFLLCWTYILLPLGFVESERKLSFSIVKALQYELTFTEIIFFIFQFSSFGHYPINSTGPQSTTNLSVSKSSVRLVHPFTGTFYVPFSWIRVGFNFYVLLQLKSHPEIYEGYVPMTYDEYLKRMSRLVVSPLHNTLPHQVKLLVDLPTPLGWTGLVNGATMLLCRRLQTRYANSFYSYFCLLYWTCIYLGVRNIWGAGKAVPVHTTSPPPSA